MSLVTDAAANKEFAQDVLAGVLTARELAAKYAMSYGTSARATALVKEQAAAAPITPTLEEPTADDGAQADAAPIADALPITQTETLSQEELPTMAQSTNTVIQTSVKLPSTLALSKSVLKPPTLDIDNAICVSLTLKKPSNSRAGDLEEVDIDAEKSSLKLAKEIFTSQTFRNIRSLDVTIRNYVKEQTLPGGEVLKGGMSLVPPTLVTVIDDELGKFSAAREELVTEFMEEYPALITAAKLTLRSQFDETDYPEPAKIRAMFYMDYSYFHFRVPDALKKISATLFEREQKKAQDRLNSYIETTEKALLASASTMVNSLIERLQPTADGKSKVIKAATVDNWRKFFETLKERNAGLTGNKALEDIAEAGRAALDGITAPSIKDSDKVREQVAQAFAKLTPLLDNSIVNAPARAISFED